MIKSGAKRFAAILLSVMLVLSAFPLNVIAAADDDGYIEVSTIEDLYNIRDNLSANYKLMNDIDLTEATAKGGDWDFMGNGWNPIGSNDIYGDGEFSGIFDGNGHTIKGMRIGVQSSPSGMSSNSCVGLFANVTGTVKNLKMDNVNIPNYHSWVMYTGAIAGKGTGADISSCTVGGLIKGYYYIGGIIGYLSGSGELLVNNASVKGGAYVGGVCGYAEKSTFDRVYNNGDVLADYSIAHKTSGQYGHTYSNYGAGICGYATGTQITNAYNAKSILVSYDDYAYSNGIAYGANCSFCYNYGTVKRIKGSTESSGLGIGGSDNKNCYYLSGTGETSSGATSLTESQMKTKSMYKGFDFDNIWMIDTNAVYPYPQLRDNPQDTRKFVSLTIESMPQKTVYEIGDELVLDGLKLKAQFDAEAVFIDVTPDMVTGFDNSKLGSQTLTVTYMGKTVSFDITVNEKVIVYKEIKTIEELYNIRTDLSGNYKLMNDIDLTEATAKGGDWDFMGNGWNPIGSNDIYGDGEFSGIFDGNGHTIKGMRIVTASIPSGTGAIYAGLFANVSGQVKNLNIISDISIPIKSNREGYIGAVAGKLSGEISGCSAKVNINSLLGYSDYNGGIAGYATGGLISHCNVRGDITVTRSYGSGICGYMGSGTKIEYCFNNANVSSSGLYACGIGYSISTKNAISMCYNSGDIKGSSYGSGITCSATIENCYNSGKTSGDAIASSTAVNCYYLSGTGRTSTGATSLTESQMKTQSMFAGFDFDKTWILDPYANYPYPQLRDNIQDLSQTVKELSILSFPTKYEYLTGEELDLTGLIVEATYVSGLTEVINITPDMLSGFDNTVIGKQTVVITKDGVTESFEVNVSKAPEIIGIEMLTNPNKTVFAVGSSFDFTGASVKVNYSDGTSAVLPVTLQMTDGGNIKKLGKQTITVTVEGFTATFDVTVTTLQVVDLKLVSAPKKTEYVEGQQFDATGLKLKAIFNSGKELEITDGFDITGYESTVGKHTVTASYNGFSVTFDVTVVPKTVLSLELKSAPNKLNYYEGQEFDKTGIVLVANYDTGESSVVEDYTVSGFKSTAGIHTVILSYGGKQISITVTVAVKVITEFMIISAPTKLIYIEGEDINTAGLKVVEKYNDGTTKEITDYQLVGFSKTPGKHIVSVVYEGNVATFEVEVAAKKLADISITYPKKLSYFIGEAFDTTGLTVTAYYDNGQNYQVEDYTVTGFDGTVAGTQTISVSYGGITKTFAVSVSKRGAISTNGAFTVGNEIARLGDTVAVPVSVKQNPGVAGFKHIIKFNPDNLKYKSVKLGNAFANGTLVVTDNNAAKGEIVVLWVSAKDVTASDIAYTIEFTVSDNAAAGSSEISILFGTDDCGNDVGDSIAFGLLNGSVEIRDYWLGDLDGDRVYKMKDLLMLAQYVSDPENAPLTEKQKLAADVNEDGKIDIRDVILLQQWLVNTPI